MNKDLKKQISIIGIIIILSFAILNNYCNSADLNDIDDGTILTTDLFETKKSPVNFTHMKHIYDYNVKCDSCHHIKETDKVFIISFAKCESCHNKEKGDRKDIMRYEIAYHNNCIGCHKEVNIKDGDPKGRKGPAPTSCTKCHPKKE